MGCSLNSKETLRLFSFIVLWPSPTPESEGYSVNEIVQYYYLQTFEIYIFLYNLEAICHMLLYFLYTFNHALLPVISLRVKE